MVDTSEIKSISIALPDELRFSPQYLRVFETSPAPELTLVRATGRKWAPSENSTINDAFRIDVKRFEDSLLPSGKDGKPSMYNGVLNTLEDFSVDDESGSICIETGTVDYFDYLVANNSEWRDSDLVEKPNALIVSALLVTEDGKLVFGRRTPNTAVPTNGPLRPQIGVIGGTFNAGRSPFERISREISKELGIEPANFDVGLKALVKDFVYFRTTLFFTGRINMTSEELEQAFELKGNKGEHSGLHFVDFGKEDISALLNEDLTVATTVGLRLLADYGM